MTASRVYELIAIECVFLTVLKKVLIVCEKGERGKFWNKKNSLE